MRFSVPSLSSISLADISSRWVHNSIEAKSDELQDHSQFIGSQLLLGSAALISLPVYLATFGSTIGINTGLVSFMVLQMFWAYLVSKTGRLHWGVYGLLSSFAALVALLSVGSGGLSSAFLVLLCLVPVEGAMQLGKRGVKIGVLLALVSISMVGLMPGDILALKVGFSAQPAVTILVIAYSLFLATRLGAYRTKIAEQLSLEQNRFRILADNAGDLITRHDQNGQTLFASPACRSLFGLSASNLLGSGLLDKIHLQDRIVYLKCISTAVHDEKEAICELRIRCKGSSQQIWKSVEMQCRPLRDPQTGRMGVVASTRNIAAEKEQQQALESAINKSEEATQAQRRFLATMSHELRTPLNAILGFSDVLKQELFGKLPHDRHREYASLIHESGQHLLNVVNDLLDISRIEAGKYELVIEPFDLIDIADATVRMMQPMALKAGVSVECDVLPTLPILTADRRSCQQILINLVSNAIKFSPEGGLVRISAKRHGRSIKIRVTDNGIGIDEAFLSTIGQPFMQADTGNSRSYEGSGLGLSVVKGLVKLHEGEFEIKSTLGEGTSVSVTIPLKTKMARPVPANVDASLVHLDTKTASLDSKNLKSTSQSRKGDSRARISA